MPQPFYLQLLQVTGAAFADLNNAIANKRVVQAPNSEALFLSRWVTQAIKQQRFGKATAPYLKGWQQRSRAQGVNAGLKQEFERIEHSYRKLMAGSDRLPEIEQSQLNALLDQLKQHGWVLDIESEFNTEVNHATGGKPSLVIAAQQLKGAFEDDILAKPLSLFVRGDHLALTALAHQHQMLLHKQSDYKSLVKYHGEYVLYPENSGPIIAELLPNS